MLYGCINHMQNWYAAQSGIKWLNGKRKKWQNKKRSQRNWRIHKCSLIEEALIGFNCFNIRSCLSQISRRSQVFFSCLCLILIAIGFSLYFIFDHRPTVVGQKIKKKLNCFCTWCIVWVSESLQKEENIKRNLFFSHSRLHYMLKQLF